MKLVADKRVRLYEVTYLVSASLTETEIAAAKEQVATLIKKHKGEVKETADWGKLPTAYAVVSNGSAHHEAVYTHLTVEMPAKNVQSLEKDMLLNEQVIRHLVVVADDQGDLA